MRDAIVRLGRAIGDGHPRDPADRSGAKGAERAALRRAFGSPLRAMAPAELQRLEELLTHPQRALLTRAVRAIREIASERER